MADDADGRRLPSRGFADIWAVVGAVAVTGLVVFAPVLRDSVLRPIVGIAFVLFAPGGALVAALFPERGPTGPEAEEAGERAGIDWLERIVFSFGASIALVPLLGLALTVTPWGIRLVPVFVALAVATLALAAVATVRRARLPPDDRLQVPAIPVSRVRAELFDPADRTDAALNVLLVASLLVAAGSVGFAVAAPNQGEQFTELYLLTENESGELTASNYPENLTVGEPTPIAVGVANHEGAQTTYTVVAELQDIAVENGEVRVRNRTVLDSFETTLDEGERTTRVVSLEADREGTRLRAAFYLYTGPEPDTRESSPYRTVSIWVNATAGSS